MDRESNVGREVRVRIRMVVYYSIPISATSKESTSHHRRMARLAIAAAVALACVSGASAGFLGTGIAPVMGAPGHTTPLRQVHLERPCMPRRQSARGRARQTVHAFPAFRLSGRSSVAAFEQPPRDLLLSCSLPV